MPDTSYPEGGIYGPGGEINFDDGPTSNDNNTLDDVMDFLNDVADIFSDLSDIGEAAGLGNDDKAPGGSGNSSGGNATTEWIDKNITPSLTGAMTPYLIGGFVLIVVIIFVVRK